jgi:hypothetical protein
VSDEHSREVDAFLAQDPLLIQAAPRAGVRVSHDRDVGRQVGAAHRPDQALDVRRDPGLVGGSTRDETRVALDVSVYEVDIRLNFALD